jgi:hypothetical protein
MVMATVTAATRTTTATAAAAAAAATATATAAVTDNNQLKVVMAMTKLPVFGKASRNSGEYDHIIR